MRENQTMDKPATRSGMKPPGSRAAERKTKISDAKWKRAMRYVANASQNTGCDGARDGARKKAARIAVDVNSHVPYIRENAALAVSRLLLYSVLCGDSGRRYADTPAANPAAPVITTHTRSALPSASRSPIINNSLSLLKRDLRTSLSLLVRICMYVRAYVRTCVRLSHSE